MKLTEMDAWFVRYEDVIATWQQVIGDPLTWKSGDPTRDVTGPRTHMVRVATLEESQGVFFQCPKCLQADGSGHYVQVTFAARGVLDHQGCHGSDGAPTRWVAVGTSLADLTTTPSILLLGGCNWHGYITQGDAA